jgi:hypothetical protein
MNGDAAGDTRTGQLERVIILGTCGSGKSTLARKLAARGGSEHIELDGLHHGPNWTAAPIDTIIWLDIPLPLILVRIVRRSLGRILHRTELWSGNRETWSNLFGKNSLVKWAVTSHRRHRAELPLRLAPPRLTDVSVVRLRSSAEVDRWLASLPPHRA